MKDAIPAVPTERHTEKEGFANRKLIRPMLNHSNHSGPSHSGISLGERRERPDRPPERSNGGRKSAPPEQTNAENFYYQKQMQSKTPMVIVLSDDEEIRGAEGSVTSGSGSSQYQSSHRVTSTSRSSPDPVTRTRHGLQHTSQSCTTMPRRSGSR